MAAGSDVFGDGWESAWRGRSWRHWCGRDGSLFVHFVNGGGWDLACSLGMDIRDWCVKMKGLNCVGPRRREDLYQRSGNVGSK